MSTSVIAKDLMKQALQDGQTVVGTMVCELRQASVMQLTDAWMVGRLGSEALAAVVPAGLFIEARVADEMIRVKGKTSRLGGDP